MQIIEPETRIEFNYLAIIGNSGTGKTNFAKTVINQTPYDMLYLCDPNRQYADYTVNDNASYISPSELKDALNLIGKRLLLQQKKGILVIEDLNLTISRISETLGCTEKHAKQLIALLLENFRKYDVKVIVILHDLNDTEINKLVEKCDTKVFFQTPLSTYQINKYTKELGFSLLEVPVMPKFTYVMKQGDNVTHNTTKALESHMAIEHDKGFMVKELLAKCRSLPEKVLVLRLHVGLKNSEIAQQLDVQRSTIDETVSRIRKRGIPIKDARCSLRLENLAF